MIASIQLLNCKVLAKEEIETYCKPIKEIQIKKELDLMVIRNIMHGPENHPYLTNNLQ